MKLININDTAAISKSDLSDMATTIIAEVENGDKNPLDALVKLKAIENVIKSAISGIQSYTIDEHAKYGEKSINFSGAELTNSETGVTYDYSECGDPIYDMWVRDMELLKATIKTREEMLRALPPTGMADPDTGAIIYPPKKKSNTTIKVTFK